MINVSTVAQGSADWHALRAKYHTASVAPAMMGVSPYKSRQRLIDELAGVVAPEPVTADKAALFARGHAAEAAGRVWAEALVGTTLAPITVHDDRLLASLDGLSPDRSVAWEHKLYSVRKAGILASGGVTEDIWQIEQILLLSGADMCLYHLSDGERTATAIYTPNAERRALLVEGWARLDADVAARKVSAAAEIAEPETALAVVAEGRVISSNVADFSAAIHGWLAQVSAETDPGAAVAHAKRCKAIQDRCEALRDGVIGQTADISAVVAELSAIAAEARSVRLKLEKLSETEANKAKAAVVAAAQARLNDARGDHPLAPRVDLSVAGKGKRTLDSYRKAVEAAADEAIRAWESATPIEDEETLLALVACGLTVDQAVVVLSKIKSGAIRNLIWEETRD